jgi:hypothetical protein
MESIRKTPVNNQDQRYIGTLPFFYIPDKTRYLHYDNLGSKTPSPMDKATSLSAWHTPPLVKDAKAIGEYPIHYYLVNP